MSDSFKNTGPLGRLATRNLALDPSASGSLSGGWWNASLPLANLLEPGLIARPARCDASWQTTASRFEMVWSRPVPINVVALLAHTLSPQALWRLRTAPPGGTLAAPDVVTPWLRVWPRRAAPASFGWEEDGWWTGASPPSGLMTHAVWTPEMTLASPPASGWGQRVQALAVEIDDTQRAAQGLPAWFDVGGLFVGAGWTPACQFSRGRSLALQARDLVDEGPSGRLFQEDRPARRSLSLSWDGLSDDDARRLFEAGAAARPDQPLLWLGAPGNAGAQAAECWPAIWAERPAPVFNFDGANDARASIQEVIA